MGIFRRGKPSDRYPDPPGMEVPDGMVAVPVDEMLDHAVALCEEAAELVVAEPTPKYLNTMATISLAILSEDDEPEKRAEAGFVSYNLFLQGYWSRTVELAAVDQHEGSDDATAVLESQHEREEHQADWFLTLNRTARVLALGGPDAEATMPGLPQGLGQDFRRVYALTSIQSTLSAIDEARPGVSAQMSEDEYMASWRLGYWVRALAMSLPEEGLAELERL